MSEAQEHYEREREREHDYDVDAALATEQCAPGERLPRCEFRCGPAGTGKTYQMLRAVAADPSYGVLSATTGIASVNLGAITVHSLLRYADTQSLRDSFLRGSLTRTLHALARMHRRLIVDEASMADAEQLDLWYRGVAEANRYSDVPEAMGITLVGDFAQLPPVRARWAFEAGCWEEFERNTVRHTTQWRQAEGSRFLDALSLVRKGMGAQGAELLRAAGARFETSLHTEFEGTTILPRNDQVGRFNQMALDRVPSHAFKVQSRRWGAQRAEWGQSRRTGEWGVPPETELKLGAYVMLLANRPDEDGGFQYVNGDCGWIIDGYKTWSLDEAKPLTIKLARNGEVVEVFPVVRGVEHSDRPEGWSGVTVPKAQDAGEYIARPHFRGRVRRYVTGQIEYFPLRLAFASTVHKTQSLTLDRLQVDFRHGFFSSPGMLYTALSRARTLEGLRLVGQPDILAKRCNVDPKVIPWL